MQVTTLACRECDTHISFAVEGPEFPDPTLQEMQTYMDLNFLARCGLCFACDWEVKHTSTVKEILNGVRNQLHTV